MNRKELPQFVLGILKSPLFLTAVSIVATVVFGYLSIPEPNQEVLWSFLEYIGGVPTVVLFLAVCFYFAQFKFTTQKLQRLEQALDPPKHHLRAQRFEAITQLPYGHLDYRPFLYYKDGYPVGLGPTILKWICGDEVRLTELNERTTWDSFLDELEEGRYDVLGTLLFETATRCRKVAFSRPLFFSDIGIYVLKDHEFWEGRLEEDGLNFSDAITLLSAVKGKLTARVIEGELSERLARKHLRHAHFIKVSQERASIPGLIDSISQMGIPSDVVFSEAIQADRTKAVRGGKVINILAPHQLLYPVGFAIRRQEYILRHFINFRLFQLEETYPGGLYGLIEEELDRASMPLPRAEIRRYYVRGSGEPSPIPRLIPFEKPSRK